MQARPDDNEIAWQYWRFLREKLRQPGRAIDLAARAHEHQAVVSALTGQPVRPSYLLDSFLWLVCFMVCCLGFIHCNLIAVCLGQDSQSACERERKTQGNQRSQ